MKEESTSVLVLAYGLVPIADIAAGLINRNEWSSTAGTYADWETVYQVQLVSGGINLLAWGSSIAVGGAFDQVFNIISKLNILAEVYNIYAVNDAESTNPAPANSTNISYGACGFGLLYSLAAAAAI